MKDVPHHMMKFMKKFMKAKQDPKIDQEEEKALNKEMKVTPSKKEVRKKKKIAIKKTREKHIPQHKSEEIKNKEMKKRTPEIRPRSNKTKH